MRERLSQGTQAFGQTLLVPNLRRAQFSFGLAWAGEWAVTVAVGILAFRHGGAAAVGIVGMVRMLPAALLAPAAAVLADRHRRERVLVGVGLIRGIALAGAALAGLALSSPLVAYGLVAIATLAHTLYRPAHSALLPSICTTATELTGANVMRGSLDSLSALLGPLLAGLLVGPIGVDGVFGVCAATALWSAWLIWRVEYETPPRIGAVERANPVREAVDGIAYVGQQPDLRLLAVLGCLQTFIRGCFAVFSVVIALQLLGLRESGVGILTSGFGAGAVLGSLAAALLVRSSGFGRWLAVGIAGWGIPFVALSVVSNEGLAIGLLGVVGLSNAIVDVSYFTLLQRLVPDELMGRVFASEESLLTLAVAAGSLATPGLIALFGIRGALVAIGLVTPLAALLALSKLRKLDARMQTAGDTLALLQRVEMLKPLPLATISGLAAAAWDEVVSPRGVVIREGSPGDDFYVIASGRAEVLVNGTSVRHVGIADCFGEIAALTGSRRTSTVRAETQLKLLRFNGRHFVRAVTGYTPSSAAASTLVRERLGHAPATSHEEPVRS